MPKTAAPITTLDALDDDLRAACADREDAFTKLMVKDTPANRQGYAEACAQVDSLLDMRHGLVAKG